MGKFKLCYIAREQEDMPFYKKILHALSIPFLVLEPKDGKFRIVDINEKYLNMVHRTKDGLLGAEAWRAFSGPSQQFEGFWGQLRESLVKVVRSGEPNYINSFIVENSQFFPEVSDKSHWELENIPILDSQGRTEFVLVLVKDIQKADLESKQESLESQVIEKELLEPLKKLEPLINKSSDLIWILNTDRKFDFVSQASRNVLGREPADFLGKHVVEVVHPEDREILQVSLDYLATHQELEVPPIRLLNTKGHWRWMEAKATNLTSDSSVKRVLFNLRDVTHFLKQEQEIRLLHERYALAVRATRDLIYDWDLVSDVRLRFYQDTRNLYGYSPEEVEKKFFWHKRIHPDDKERALKVLELHLKDREANFVENSYRIRTKNGGFAHVVDHGFIIRDKEGNAVRLVGAMRDVTELINQKEALEVANERYNMAMKATNEMIWDWDLNADVITRSAAFPAVYGFDGGEAQKASFWISRVHPEDRQQMQSTLMTAIDDGLTTQWLSDYRVKAADGNYKHVIDRAWISRETSGRAMRIVGATLDVTESKKAYDRIHQQNKLLREIAWDQSHLVRAPLSRLLGLIQYMEQMPGGNDLDSEEWQNLKASATELDDIVRKIVKKSEDLDF